jgi:hypothetical protein
MERRDNRRSATPVTVAIWAPPSQLAPCVELGGRAGVRSAARTTASEIVLGVTGTERMGARHPWHWSGVVSVVCRGAAPGDATLAWCGAACELTATPRLGSTMRVLPSGGPSFRLASASLMRSRENIAWPRDVDPPRPSVKGAARCSGVREHGVGRDGSAGQAWWRQGCAARATGDGHSGFIA